MGLALALPLLTLCQSPLSPGEPILLLPRGPAGIAIDDIDGDGREDLVHFDVNLDTGASIFFGPLDAGRPGVRVREDGGPSTGGAVGDVDGDGLMDVVLAIDADGQPQLVRHLGVAGSHQFDRQDPVALPGPLGNLTVADLDGDGRLDLLGVVAPANELISLRGVAGGFAHQAPQSIFASDATSYRVEDLTGDGALDLLVQEIGNYRLLIGDGLGGFAPPITIPVTSTGYRPGARGMLLSDLDGDGVADLLNTDGSALTLAAGRGDGTFEAPVAVSAPISGYTLPEPQTLVDLDGDGDLDVIGFSDYGVFDFRPSTFENVGGGAFGPPREIASGILETVGPGLVADLLGDGEVDLVGPFGGARGVRAGNGIGSFDPFDPDPTVWALDLDGPVQSVFGDFDGDGDVDVVLSDLADQAEILFIEALGAGVFAAPRAVQTPFMASEILQVVDLDLDGDVDLAGRRTTPLSGAPLEMVLFDGDAAVGFGSVPTNGVAFTGYVQEFSDLDGDGDVDIVRGTSLTPSSPVGTVTVLLGDGAGGFQSVSSFPYDSFVQLADIDRDGLDDILQMDSSAGILDWRQNLGGSFAPRLAILTSLPPVNFGRKTFLGDVNGDQASDLLLLGRGGELSIALRAPGAANFGLPTSSTLPGVTAVLQFGAELVDLDADGQLDFAMPESSGLGSSFFFRGLGGGQFDAPVDLVQGGARTFGPFVDIDQDGDLDALRGILIDAGVGALPVGEVRCDPAVPNAAGRPATLRGFEVQTVSGPRISLRAVGLPPNQFGLVAGSLTAGAPMPVAGSVGQLCLGGAIGRYDAPGQILFSGPAGSDAIEIDPAALETPSGPVAAQAGEVWTFQAWYRDVAGGAATSNFTEALAIQF